MTKAATFAKRAHAQGARGTWVNPKAANRRFGGGVMLLTCLALGVLACHDDAVSHRTGQVPLAQPVPSGPVILAHASCTLTVADGAGTIDCGRTRLRGPRVNMSATLYPFGPYVFVTLTHLVNDTVAQTWAVGATVQNLLGEPIGTLDGTTVLGVYSVITGLQVTSGSGTLSVANADGDSTFTAPNQPYCRYPQIVAPQQTSAVKTWRFNVPNTAKSINIDFTIVADFPAERSVAGAPPSSRPMWMYDDSNLVAASSLIGVQHVKNVLVVAFRADATLADKQLAVGYVGGSVIGGIPVTHDDGLFYVSIPFATSDRLLLAAMQSLTSLSQVESASPEPVFSFDSTSDDVTPPKLIHNPRGPMRKSRFTEEQILQVLQEWDAGGKPAELCRPHGITETTLYRLYRWKRKYGGLQVSEAKRLKALEDENRQLKRLVAAQALNLQVVKDLLGKKW